MDRLELRRKNFITDFPAPMPHGFIYDSGDYHGTLDKCLEMLDLDAFRREQAELRERGVYRGVGFSTYVEICGLGPSRALGPKGWGMQGGYFESAPGARAPDRLGDRLHRHLAARPGPRDGLRPDRGRPARASTPEVVEVIHGDTNTGPFGKNTYGSRSLAVGGEAIARAAEKVQDKAKRIVAHKLEAAPEDIEVSRRQLPGARARPTRVDDAGRRRRRGLHRHGPARGHGGRPRRDLLLRPGELRLAVRRARVRHRGRRGDRQGRRSSATSRSTTAGRRSTRC